MLLPYLLVYIYIICYTVPTTQPEVMDIQSSSQHRQDDNCRQDAAVNGESIVNVVQCSYGSYSSCLNLHLHGCLSIVIQYISWDICDLFTCE